MSVTYDYTRHGGGYEFSSQYANRGPFWIKERIDVATVAALANPTTGLFIANDIVQVWHLPVGVKVHHCACKTITVEGATLTMTAGLAGVSFLASHNLNSAALISDSLVTDTYLASTYAWGKIITTADTFDFLIATIGAQTVHHCVFDLAICVSQVF